MGMKIGEQNVVAYTDDTIIMGETEDGVRNTRNKQIEEGRGIGLGIYPNLQYL